MLLLKPKLLLGLLAVLAMSLLMVACGDDDDEGTEEPGGGSTATTASGGTPKRGGEITIVYPEPESFDPHYSAFAQDIDVQRMVFRGLFKLNKDNKAEAELSASLPDLSSDGKTYTVTSKPGLRRADGHP